MNNQDVPAIYTESPYTPQTPDQVAAKQADEQGFKISNASEKSQPSPFQKAADIGTNVHDMAEAAADGQKLKENAEKANDISNSVNNGNKHNGEQASDEGADIGKSVDSGGKSSDPSSGGNSPSSGGNSPSSGVGQSR